LGEGNNIVINEQLTEENMTYTGVGLMLLASFCALAEGFHVERVGVGSRCRLWGCVCVFPVYVIYLCSERCFHPMRKTKLIDSATVDIPPDPLEGARVPFDAWCRAGTTDAYDGGAGLNLESQAMYRSLWDNWNRWLYLQGKTHWSAATAELVGRFLREREPAGYRAGLSRAARKIPDSVAASSAPRKMMAYTANRYFHVLTSVYTFLSLLGRLPGANPIEEADAEPAKVPEDDRRMQTLPVHLWRRARAPATMVRHFEDRTRWTDRRNHALVAILFDAGLATNELQRLTADCIVDSDSKLPLLPVAISAAPVAAGGRPSHVVPHQADAFSRKAHRPLSVQVLADNAAGTVERTLPLGEAASSAVRAWLGERIHLLRSAPLDAKASEGLQRSGTLFLTTRIKSQGYDTGMDSKSIHRVVATYLGDVHAELPAEHAAVHVPHWGPSTVRNCVIQTWVAEMGKDRILEVLQMAGLQGQHDLRRITEGALSGSPSTAQIKTLCPPRRRRAPGA
jgi:site-specific recombinase XerC